MGTDDIGVSVGNEQIGLPVLDAIESIRTGLQAISGAEVSIAFEDHPARKLGRNSKVLGVHVDAMPESPRIRVTVDLLVPISIWLALTALEDFGFQHVRLYDGDTTILVAPSTVASYSVRHLPSTIRKAEDGTATRTFQTRVRLVLARLKDDWRQTNAERRQAALLECRTHQDAPGHDPGVGVHPVDTLLPGASMP